MPSLYSLPPKEMSDMMKHLKGRTESSPKRLQAIRENILSVIAIQTHKQPINGNNIQAGGGILSLGVVTKLKLNVFVTSVGDSLPYVLMRHA